MRRAKPRILYVTDLTYQARGRRYCDEDIRLSADLAEEFDVALCHPAHAAALLESFDVTVVRNSGPVLHHREQYDAFRAEALVRGARVFNPLTGQADMAGKQYLVDLSVAGYPVIPTVDRREDLGRLPAAARYVVKPKLGADSIGLEVLDAGQLETAALGDVLVQPLIPFRYEVSFYFVGRSFQYALYAPRPHERWALEPYTPTVEDLAFAQRFVDWNSLAHGIQRVDACRAPDGELLLVELEDLNPYLSLDLIDPATREAFVAAMKASIRGLLAEGPGSDPATTG